MERPGARGFNNDNDFKANGLLGKIQSSLVSVSHNYRWYQIDSMKMPSRQSHTSTTPAIVSLPLHQPRLCNGRW